MKLFLYGSVLGCLFGKLDEGVPNHLPLSSPPPCLPLKREIFAPPTLFRSLSLWGPHPGPTLPGRAPTERPDN